MNDFILCLILFSGTVWMNKEILKKDFGWGQPEGEYKRESQHLELE